MATSEATRRLLLDSAAAVLTRHSGASLADVAAAAGVGRTTLHRYFPGRADLLRALALDALERVEAAVTSAEPGRGDPIDAVLERVAVAVLPFADELRFLDVGAEVWDLPDLVERWYDAGRPLEDAVRRAQRRGELRPELPVAWVVDLFTAAVWAASSGVSDGRIARRDAVRLVLETVLHGVATTAPTQQEER